MMSHSPTVSQQLKRGLGFAYVEVLVAVVLLAVLLAPALNALTNGVRGTSVEPATNHLNLRNKMEAVLSQPFSALYAGTGGSCTNAVTDITGFSDASGSTDRRVVVIYRFNYATSACTTSDTGLLMVKVFYESGGGVPASSLYALTGKWW